MGIIIRMNDVVELDGDYLPPMSAVLTLPSLIVLKVALAMLKGDKHVLSISRTGSGKTLTFWLPVILSYDGIVIVVLPLNVLAKQNLDQLTRAGINSVVVTGETASAEQFEVSK